MTGRRWILAISLALVLLVLAIVAFLFVLPETKPPTTANVVGKGGLINLAPEGSPLPTGAAEPTFPPTSANPTPVPNFPTAPPAKATASATAIANTAPHPTRQVEIAPSPTSNATQGIIPWKVRIPAIGVDTYVERVGVTKEGLMDVPKNIWNTAWFGNGGFRPGEPGNAVIAGHLDAPGTRAVFWDLDKLKPQDKIYVTDREGHQLIFEVRNSQAFSLDNAPLATVFGPAQTSNLNLITCSGAFDRLSRNYDKRLVVFSKLVE